jgi:hypothetical protein
MKTLRRLAGKRMTPLLRIDFDKGVVFVYAEVEDDDWVEKAYIYRDFETALAKELERLGKRKFGA